MDDVAPPTVKLSDDERHVSLLFSFLFEISLCFGANEIINFQKLVGNLDKMIVPNLGRNTKDLWTLIPKILESICICLKL